MAVSGTGYYVPRFTVAGNSIENTSTPIYDLNGNVGVGTTSPLTSYKLTIQNTQNTFPASTDTGAERGNTSINNFGTATNQYVHAGGYYNLSYNFTGGSIADVANENGLWGAGVYQLYKAGSGGFTSGYPSGIVSQLLLNGSGTIANYCGIRILHPQNFSSGTTWTGTLTNYFGIRIESTTAPAQSVEATITNKWGLYQVGSADKNYFAGNVQINNSLAVGNITPSATTGRIDASNDVVAFSTSDIRLKTNIKLISNPIEKIKQIGGYNFDWKEDEELVKLHGFKGSDIGVIAQELEEVLPEIVTTRDSGYKAVKYEKIVPLLIEAIKEQQKQIDELKSIINGLTS